MTTGTTPRTVSHEILEDRWQAFTCRPADGTFRPAFLRLCQALNVAADAVLRIPHDEETAPLEHELVELVHDFIVRRAESGKVPA